MSIEIKELRDSVDRAYVGIRLNTDKVKPVHIANGLFREASESIADTKLLHRFVFDQTNKGVVPKGHALDDLLEDLNDVESLESGIENSEISKFRRQLKKVVSADDGVFTGQMQSYSAASTAFLSKDTVGQDAGGFFVAWLEHIKSGLLEQIQECLESSEDVISVMCSPLLSEDNDDWERSVEVDELKFASSHLRKSAKSSHWTGLKLASETLAEHLHHQPDKLFHMRLVVSFASLVVLRHVAALESYYVKDAKLPPFLLDFGMGNGLKEASKQSYSRCRSSISRFYAYAFGQELKRTHSVQDLSKCRPPVYADGNNTKLTQQGNAIWKLKKASIGSAKNKYNAFGEAIFDMLALNANATAIQYFKGLGGRIGLLHPKKGAAVPWFRPSPDLIELLLYCCLEPDEPPVELSELCNRFEERFGVLTGGGQNDEEILESNAIYSWDRDALSENVSNFKKLLIANGFATELADGITTVSTGVLS